WIRYEEEYDKELEKWQAPRVGCLSFHSLLELRRGLQYEQDIECIYDSIINDAIENGQLNKDVKDELHKALIVDHKHPESHSFSAFRRRSSAIDFPQSSARRSSLAFRKNDIIHCDGPRRMSSFELKPNGELNKNFKSTVVKYDNIDESVVTNVHIKNCKLDEEELHGSSEKINQEQQQSPLPIQQHRPSQAHM
ncbi:unnamed protein product, partial [Didymodactylos carnosus]